MRASSSNKIFFPTLSFTVIVSLCFRSAVLGGLMWLTNAHESLVPFGLGLFLLIVGVGSIFRPMPPLLIAITSFLFLLSLTIEITTINVPGWPRIVHRHISGNGRCPPDVTTDPDAEILCADTCEIGPPFYSLVW